MRNIFKKLNPKDYFKEVLKFSSGATDSTMIVTQFMKEVTITIMQGDGFPRTKIIKSRSPKKSYEVFYYTLGEAIRGHWRLDAWKINDSTRKFLYQNTWHTYD